MGDDFHRRRRLTENGPRRSGGGNNLNPWIVTVAAAIVVVLGGWFLGQGLAHMLGPKDRQTAQNELATPTPAITPLASPQPSASAEPTATPEPSPTAAPTASTAPTATPAATAAPTQAPVAVATRVKTAAPAPSATPVAAVQTQPPATPAPVKTMRPRTSLPVARRPETATQPPAAPAQENSDAAQTVRAYIDALKRGDPQAAALYLGNGSPDEDFITADTRITNLSSTANGDGSYKVGVDMQTSHGEYYETFMVAQTGNGSRILSKTAIKP